MTPAEARTVLADPDTCDRVKEAAERLLDNMGYRGHQHHPQEALADARRVLKIIQALATEMEDAQ